ncbi:MAG TPA: hypothetical protein DC049_14610 [Spirochaetia bacterium]|nr:hypothetical protein [Spirochaetia bacterium]
MTIDKIQRVNNLYTANGSGKADRPGNVKRDSVNISSEAMHKAELENFLKISKSTPDIRADKVADAKTNLEKYRADSALFDNVLKTIAGRILKVLS